MAGGERRLQILRLAVRLFSQRGFRGTTTKEIALAAGVSEAMVFRHFATKEELYSAILDHKACMHDTMDPVQVVADAIARKDDRAVFEGLALDALNQRDGAMIQIEPLVIVRAFVCMVIHHSLNNNLWDRKQSLLEISNQAAARAFT